MKWMHATKARLRLLFRGEAEERMEEELRFHIEMETAKNLRAGMSPAEARRRAVLAFGGVEGHKEAMRDGRTFAWADGLSLDVKLGARMLAKHRGLALIGGFAIAVAITVGAAFFEVISEVLRSEIPVDDGHRVVAIQYATDNPGSPERRIIHDFAGWRGSLKTVEELGAFRTVRQNLGTGEGQPEPVKIAEMTASGFGVARTPPLLGRYLVPEDERTGAPPVVVIGYAAWRNQFAGDPRVVGRTVRIGAEPHTIVGVMPEGFAFPVSHRFWVPLRADPAEFGRLDGPKLYVFGRLAPGVSMDEAQAELAAAGRRTAAAHPATHARLRPRVLPYTREHMDGLDQPMAVRALSVLRFLVGGLLVVVAVNLAILFYARTVARRGEIAVRTALGASRRRILSQLFVEALVLAAIGAAAGLLMAHAALRWGVAGIARINDVPFWLDFRLSAGTVLFAAGLAVLAAAIAGVLPGLKATGGRSYANLRALGGSAPLGRLWSGLVVAQVAVAVAILPAAVFTVWKVARMESTDIGFPSAEFVVGNLAMEEGGTDGRFAARQLALMARLAAEPGVTAVAFSSAIPGVDGEPELVEIEGGSPADAEAGSIHVGPGMFDVYGARIVAGRAFTAGDAGAGTVVVNRTFARRHFGSRAAPGRRFRYLLPAEDGVLKPSPWYEIAGVVEDFPAVSLEIASSADGVPNVYHPATPGQLHPVTLSVRFRGAVPAGAAGRMQALAAEVDPALHFRARPLDELYGSFRSASRFAAWGLAIATSSVLLLCAAGIYALISFTLVQRTREIGIRTALGAHPRRILATLLGRVARQLSLGLLAGSALAGALFFILGLSPARAAALLASVAAIMLAVGMAAAASPARRGLRIQPMEALREQ
jgi:predicted permease